MQYQYYSAFDLHRCGPRSDMWGAFPLYCGKCCFTLWRCHLCEWAEFFLWPFCLWAKRRPSTVSIGPSFCVPFCLWALVPLLLALAGLNFWVKLLRELNTALLNFFWGGKKDLVALMLWFIIVRIVVFSWFRFHLLKSVSPPCPVDQASVFFSWFLCWPSGVTTVLA